MKGVIAILKAFKETKIMEAARNLVSLFLSVSSRSSGYGC
jgi:hypothetical protein